MDDTDMGLRLERLLREIEALAEEVRLFAERVHRETEETRRLAALTRNETGRSRDLSRSGSRHAQQVQDSVARGRAENRDRNSPDAGTTRC